jgi:hypothetical protein
MALLREKVIDAEFDAEGRATIRLPELSPGLHRLLVSEIQETAPVMTQPEGDLIPRPLDLPAWPWGNWPVDATFSRDELYAEVEDD